MAAAILKGMRRSSRVEFSLLLLLHTIYGFLKGKIYLEICHRRMSSNLSISMVVAPASAPLAAKESNTIHGSHTYFSSILFR